MKWKKFRLSKRQFPTRIIGDGNSRHLQIGKEMATAALRKMLGRDVSHMKIRSSRGEWIFMEPLKGIDHAENRTTTA
jgi:hypothetical protein